MNQDLISDRNYSSDWDVAHAFHQDVRDGIHPVDYYNGFPEAQNAVLHTYERKVIPLAIENDQLRLDELLQSFGILNNRAVNRWLTREIESWRHNSRHNHSSQIPDGLIFVLMDLDGLKQINGEDGQGVKRGHDMGDAALTVLGEGIARISRVGDILARIGGDEFLVIMKHSVQNDPGKAIEGDDGLIARLRRIVAEGRALLIKQFADRWPADTSSRKLGEVSVGWQLLSVDEILNKYDQFNRMAEADRATTLIGYLTREADKMLFRDKGRYSK